MYVHAPSHVKIWFFFPHAGIRFSVKWTDFIFCWEYKRVWESSIRFIEQINFRALRWFLLNCCFLSLNGFRIISSTTLCSMARLCVWVLSCMLCLIVFGVVGPAASVWICVSFQLPPSWPELLLSPSSSSLYI